MFSIGEIAGITGVSRRMLRHWETAGLIAPASVDEHTGYRRYSRTQVGRVRAIAALRAAGFALDDVRDLLDHPHLTQSRLVELLRVREQELVSQMDEASACLAEVRQRLHSIEKGQRTIMSTLELSPLPALRLAALRATVSDESEIGEAVSALLPRLREEIDSRGVSGCDVVLTYDGADDATIVVTAGAADIVPVGGTTELTFVDIADSDRGVTVRFDPPPSDIGDAWISLDAALEAYELETTGVYRQTLTSTGTVILQAPVRSADGHLPLPRDS